MAPSPPEHHSPIARMPAEILTRIFDIHVHDTLQRFDKSPSQSTLACARDCSPYSWIRISHVCQHWRSLALSTPLLWSTIIVTRQTECMQAMLERSQHVPLHIRAIGPGACYISRPVPLKSLRLVLTAMHRVRTLDLAINWWVHDELAVLLQQPAPLLRQARLSTPNGGYDGGWLCPVASLGQPHADSANPDAAAPQAQTQIEELVLSCYAFPWTDPHPFRTLKHLRVNNRGLACPSIEQVAYTLGALPRLVTLVLHGVLHGGSVHTLGRAYAGAISLRELEQLTLSGDSLACATVLKLLEIPKTTRITLVYTSERNLDALAYSMPHVNKKLEAGAGEGNEQGWMSMDHSQSSCSLNFYHTPSTHTTSRLEPEDAQPRLTLKAHPSTAHIEAMCRHLDLSAAKALQMTPLPGMDLVPWLPLLKQFYQFREAHLVQWQLSDVVELLLHSAPAVGAPTTGGDAPEGDIEPSSPSVYLPELSMLALWDAQCTSDATVADLVVALASRKKRGRRLERLVLRECTSLCPMDVSALAGLVGQLDWDGRLFNDAS